MTTQVRTAAYCVIQRDPVGRIGDYSQGSAIFIGLNKKKMENFKRVSVYSMIDIPNKWNAPHSRFTSNGGRSQEVLQHLRHIFYAHQNTNEKTIKFLDEFGARLLLSMERSGDITIGTEDPLGEYGAVPSFKEDHALYKDLVLLHALIDDENQKNQERNPFFKQLLRERFKQVNMFP